jgi:hypothetical protein
MAAGEPFRPGRLASRSAGNIEDNLEEKGTHTISHLFELVKVLN